MLANQTPKETATIATRNDRAMPATQTPDQTATVGPEQALAVAARARGALGASAMLALQNAAGNRAVVGLRQMKAGPSATTGAQAMATQSPHRTELGALAGPAPSAGASLPETVRLQMERALGADFRAVRIHQGDHVRALGARAYARGNEIHFAPGEYDPSSPRGLELLGHELAHLVQQASGRVGGGGALHRDRGLESDADRLGALAARGERAASQSQVTITPGTRSAAQAKFGFEVELDLALGWSSTSDPAQPDEQYAAPDAHLAAVPVIGTAAGVELHLDHSASVTDPVSGSNAIVELTTSPAIDEYATSEQDVRARMTQFTSLVEGFASATNNLTRRAALADVPGISSTGASNGTLFVGGSSPGKQQLASGYMQVTFGVALEKVPQVFEGFSSPEINHAPASRAAAQGAIHEERTNQVIAIALASARRAWKPTDNGLVSDWGELATNADDRDIKLLASLQQLRGLSTLIINYLLVSRFVEPNKNNKLLKNHLGSIFYKTSLATLRNKMDRASGWVVHDATARESVIVMLASAGTRNLAEPLFPKVEPKWITVVQWLTEVLTGARDPVWEEAKNDWSHEIVDSVGPPGTQRPSVALELRRAPPPDGWKYTTPELTELASPANRPIGEWGEVAVAWWEQLRSTEGPGEDSPDSTPSDSSGKA